MTTLSIVALAVGLACPAHMLWNMRRGKRGCCAPAVDDAAALRERQARLAEDLARSAMTHK